MSTLNKVMLIGRLGKDPELRFTPNGQAVCKFSVATSEKWKDKDGELKSRTDWHNVVVWGRRAEACGEHLKKGAQIYVEGKLSTNSWEDKDGVKRYKTEITAHAVTFLSKAGASKANGEDRNPDQDAGSDNMPPPPTSGYFDAEDEIPF